MPLSPVYSIENNGFRISVRTEFDFTNSNPLQHHYLFSYTIDITNLNHRKAQLLARTWHIKDATGQIRMVEGPGVVGYTPWFEAGESFNYSSFSPLPTLTGEMWGQFHMIDVDKKKFSIDTPVFRFAVPDEYIDRY